MLRRVLSAAVRIGRDPLLAPAGALTREACIRWRMRGSTAEELREAILGWSGPEVVGHPKFAIWQFDVPDNVLTEDAAIVVSAIVIHELEGAIVTSVLQTGTGSDYHIQLRGGTASVLEVSGIKNDDTGHRSLARVRAKAEQLLARSEEGYVGVVSFRNPTDVKVTIFLYHVSNGTNGVSAPRRQVKKRKIKKRKDPSAAVVSADAGGAASVAGMEGQFAKRTGDVETARKKYQEAAEILLRGADIPTVASHRCLIRLLAASQYFHGGMYREAVEVCKRIDPNLLKGDDKLRLENLLRVSRGRLRPDYPVRVRLRTMGYAKTNPRKSLDLMSTHAYVYTQYQHKFLRAILCENLQEWEAAASYFAEAIALRPDDYELAFLPLALPLDCMRSGEDRSIVYAARYSRELAKRIPSRVTYFLLSMSEYRLAVWNAKQLEEDQPQPVELDFHQSSLTSYFRAMEMPGYPQNATLDFAVRSRAFEELAHQYAALSFGRLGRREDAAKAVRRALQLFPDSQVSRDMLRYFETNSPEALLLQPQPRSELLGYLTGRVALTERSFGPTFAA